MRLIWVGFYFVGWLLWRVLMYQALQWMNRHSYRSVCSGIDSWSQWHRQLVTFSLTPQLCQLPNSKWEVDQVGIEELTETQLVNGLAVLLGLAWAGSVCVTMAMSRECVCYHDNKVYLSGLTPAVEEVHDIPWGLGLTPVVEEVHGIPWGLQLTRHCLIAYTCIPLCLH